MDLDDDPENSTNSKDTTISTTISSVTASKHDNTTDHRLYGTSPPIKQRSISTTFMSNSSSSSSSPSSRPITSSFNNHDNPLKIDTSLITASNEIRRIPITLIQMDVSSSVSMAQNPNSIARPPLPTTTTGAFDSLQVEVQGDSSKQSNLNDVSMMISPQPESRHPNLLPSSHEKNHVDNHEQQTVIVKSPRFPASIKTKPLKHLEATHLAAYPSDVSTPLSLGTSPASTTSAMTPTPVQSQNKHKMPRNIARILTELREEKSPFLKEIEHEKITNKEVKTDAFIIMQSPSAHVFDESDTDSSSAMTSVIDLEIVSNLHRPSPSPRLKDPLAYVTQSSRLNPENHVRWKADDYLLDKFPSVRIRDEGLSPTIGPSTRSKRKLSATDLIVDKLDLASHRVIKKPALRYHPSLSPRPIGLSSAQQFGLPSPSSSSSTSANARHSNSSGSSGPVSTSVHGLFTSMIHGQIHPHRPRSYSNSSMSSMSSIHLPAPANVSLPSHLQQHQPTSSSTLPSQSIQPPTLMSLSTKDYTMTMNGLSPRSPHPRPQMLNLTGAGEDFSKMSLSDT